HGPTIYRVPPGSTYRFGSEPGQQMTLHEKFNLEVPSGKNLRLNRAGDGSGFVLPEGAKRKVPGSSWGASTIACTIPIALCVGWYMYRSRKGKIVEASLVGGVAVLTATFAGASVPGSPLEPVFSGRGTRPSPRSPCMGSSPRCCQCGCCSSRATTSRASS